MVRAKNPRPAMVKCGTAQRCMFLGPKEEDALVSWEVYVTWQRDQQEDVTDMEIRRQLREEPVKRLWWPKSKKWLEVSTPVDMDLVLDGVHMKTRVAVVLQGQLKEGVTLGKQQLRCWKVKCTAEATGVIDVDSDANVELEFLRGQEASVRLRELLDTGAGLSLMSLNAWKRISTQNRYIIRKSTQFNWLLPMDSK